MPLRKRIQNCIHCTTSLSLDATNYTKLYIVIQGSEYNLHKLDIQHKGATNPLPADAAILPADARGTFHLPPAEDRIDAPFISRREDPTVSLLRFLGSCPHKFIGKHWIKFTTGESRPTNQLLQKSVWRLCRNRAFGKVLRIARENQVAAGCRRRKE